MTFQDRLSSFLPQVQSDMDGDILSSYPYRQSQNPYREKMVTRRTMSGQPVGEQFDQMLQDFSPYMNVNMNGKVIVLLMEPEKKHSAFIAVENPRCCKPVYQGCKMNNTCGLVKKELDANGSCYLDHVCKEKVAMFLYRHRYVDLLVSHSGHLWHLKGEGIVEKYSNGTGSFSFTADHFMQEGSDIPDGVFPLFWSIPCNDEFCRISVESCMIYTKAELAEAIHLKRKVYECLEKKYSHIHKKFREMEHECGDPSESTCDKAYEIHKYLKKFHMILQPHNAIMKELIDHCRC